MSKKNYILMVFEGEKTEKIIFDSLREHFLTNSTNRIIYGFHCGEIYSLYSKLTEPENESLFFILKEKLKVKNPVLQDIIEEYVEAIYLFFDYDGHANADCNVRLQDMLEFFNDEFENGKLFVSYPMVESIKHLKENICFDEIKSISNSQYKTIARSNCDNHLKKFGESVGENILKENWNYIINEHCKKANYIVNNIFSYPQVIIAQDEIHQKQIEKYDTVNNEVAVLSAFPLMLLDYYGHVKLKELIL